MAKAKFGPFIGQKPPSQTERPTCPFCGRPDTPEIEYQHAKDQLWHHVLTKLDGGCTGRRWTGKWHNAWREHFCSDRCLRQWALAVRDWMRNRFGQIPVREPVAPRTKDA